MPEDIGNWTYVDAQENDGYGGVTRHVWENDELDATVRVAPSEGMHIMECDRGDWQVDVNIGSGGNDNTYCFDTEEEALSNVEDLLPSA